MSYVDNDSTLTTKAWFRPAVGLWFGMLVGAGTLGVLYVTPADTRDVLFQSAGLTGLHRFFEPPVGMAGFAAVAVAAGVVGFLFGLVIASRLARRAAVVDQVEIAPETVEAEASVAEDQSRRRVFSAREDIGEEGIAVTETAEALAAPEIKAEFEEIEEVKAPAEELASASPVAPAPAARESLADLSLDQLTSRLAAALEARKAAPGTPPADEDPDQVISFLRREAARAAPPAGPGSEDPQAALRSALDKLGRVGKPD
ncbi:hypothetical protein [Qipengyuania gaetbuli]|uniref:hypothetical protein n=1 Tax=Qipengyuania gaetbuli TaxID=266952 RepID=UPI001CD4F44F|nr:hypothetical protein [Qipengyuania gaetbuli]MCA0909996.1 hypothetical protein [Qipengyuania gaetbuli]